MLKCADANWILFAADLGLPCPELGLLGDRGASRRMEASGRALVPGRGGVLLGKKKERVQPKQSKLITIGSGYKNICNPLGFTSLRKKAEFLDKSTKTIAILSDFLEPK